MVFIVLCHGNQRSSWDHGLWKGTQVIKLDIRNTCRVVPIYSDDRWLMGMIWEDSLFVNMALPFGLLLASKIFTALADTTEWMVRQEGMEFVINYLDDFLVIIAADEHQCSHAMRLLLETFGTPRAPNSVVQAGRPVAMLDFPRV